ncbi:MAG TPA: amidohydrolase family protein, partial [Candidatus Limnocylindria bacterium]
MTRTIYAGATIVDGTGADAAVGDLVVDNGRIVELGTSLDGDERVDLAGAAILPGLFDCHTHVVVSTLDEMKNVHTPFGYRYYQAAENLRATLGVGITTARDAGGADLGIKQALADGLIPGPRLHISLSMVTQTGGHGDPWTASGGDL